MNMTDTKKCFRGVLLWREDVIKCAKIVKKPLSEFVRELLHAEMQKHRLGEEEHKILNAQIEAAYAARKSRQQGQKRVKHNKSLTVDVMSIPAKVRKSAKFVKG